MLNFLKITNAMLKFAKTKNFNAMLNYAKSVLTKTTTLVGKGDFLKNENPKHFSKVFKKARAAPLPSIDYSISQYVCTVLRLQKPLHSANGSGRASFTTQCCAYVL